MQIEITDEEYYILHNYRCGYKPIWWHEDDFEARARQLEEIFEDRHEVEHATLYNREDFSHALCKMIKNHDASHGISWDTIDYYLDEYCKIKQDE